MERSSYPLVDAEAAAALVLERTSVLGGEDVHLAECAGRVLVRDLVAPSQLPPFPSSAVDGSSAISNCGPGASALIAFIEGSENVAAADDADGVANTFISRPSSATAMPPSGRQHSAEMARSNRLSSVVAVPSRRQTAVPSAM